MNVKLTNTEEWKDGKNEGTLGEVFIRYHPLPFAYLCYLGWVLTSLRRCNNVLWISESAGSYDGDRMQQD